MGKNKKRIIDLGFKILFIWMIVTIVLCILYFPRNLKNYMGIKYEDINSISVEISYDDEIKKYVLEEERKECFYEKIKNINVKPTHSYTKSKSQIEFVIETKNQTFIFCDYYYSSEKESRNEFEISNLE